MPDRFVTSGIGLSDLDKGVTVSQQIKVTGREEARATVETDQVEKGHAKSDPDDAITITDYAEAVDENPPDARLTLITSDGRLAYTLRRRITRIGRNNENDIVIDSDRVSRHHAEILCESVPEGDTFSIVDKGSRNGIWVNKQRVKESSAIKSGDAIRIGRLEFTFLVKDDQKD
jgi:pSer/pThr/pTyr-binding forkhead associated (FHA) protein